MPKQSILFRCVILFLTMSLLLPLPAEAAGDEPAEIINILLIGQDCSAEASARSDSIILCSIQPEAKAITITSFLRDLYLPIPGYGSNRLNAAYAFGGPDLLLQTLQTHFDMAVDGWVAVDFSSFPQIIDLLGGVELELRQDEADAINRAIPGTLTEGIQQLTGQQALAYSRIRKLDQDGDLSRSSRQRKLISSLLDSYRSANLLTILSTVVDILPMLSTDLTKKEILVLAAKLFPLLDDPTVSGQRIPADGTYAAQRIQGMDVLVANLEENKKILIEISGQSGIFNK